jgi:hypothetical protein
MTNKLNRKVLDKRDTRETHTSQVWREELAEMLEVNLRQREALKLDSIPSHVQRMAAHRALARCGNKVSRRSIAVAGERFIGIAHR